MPKLFSSLSRSRGCSSLRQFFLFYRIMRQTVYTHKKLCTTKNYHTLIPYLFILQKNYFATFLQTPQKNVHSDGDNHSTDTTTLQNTTQASQQILS